MLKIEIHNRAIDNPYKDYDAYTQRIINTFVGNASISAMRQWVVDGKKIPMDQVIQIVSELIEHGVQSITHKNDA